MTGNLDHYASYVGVEQGIFEKYGINLEITEYAFGINTIDAIANGNADVGDMADYAAVNRLGTTLDQTNLVMFSEPERRRDRRRRTLCSARIRKRPLQTGRQQGLCNADRHGKRVPQQPGYRLLRS